MSDAVSWQEIFEHAAEGFLGTDADDPFPKGRLVTELRSRGYSVRELDRAVDEGVLDIVEAGIPPKYEFVEHRVDDSPEDVSQNDISESSSSTSSSAVRSGTPSTFHRRATR